MIPDLFRVKSFSILLLCWRTAKFSIIRSVNQQTFEQAVFLLYGNTGTGLWFGTSILLSHSYWEFLIIPIDEVIFFRGVFSTTDQSWAVRFTRLRIDDDNNQDRLFFWWTPRRPRLSTVYKQPASKFIQATDWG